MAICTKNFKIYFTHAGLNLILAIVLSWGKQSFSDESKSAVLDSVTRLSAGTGWREKEKALEDVTGVYYYNAMKIQEMFHNAVSNHRQNRDYYSPLHTSIMAVGVWRIRPAIDELMQVIDYCIDAKTIPDGLMMLGQSFYPAVESLILLGVEPERLVEFIAKENESRRTSLAAYVLCRRLKGKEKAFEYLNRELVHYTNDRQRSNIQKAIDLIKKVEYDSDLIPSPYNP